MDRLQGEGSVRVRVEQDAIDTALEALSDPPVGTDDKSLFIAAALQTISRLILNADGQIGGDAKMDETFQTRIEQALAASATKEDGDYARMTRIMDTFIDDVLVPHFLQNEKDPGSPFIIPVPEDPNMMTISAILSAKPWFAFSLNQLEWNSILSRALRLHLLGMGGQSESAMKLFESIVRDEHLGPLTSLLLATHSSPLFVRVGLMVSEPDRLEHELRELLDPQTFTGALAESVARHLQAFTPEDLLFLLEHTENLDQFAPLLQQLAPLLLALSQDENLLAYWPEPAIEMAIQAWNAGGDDVIRQLLIRQAQTAQAAE